MRKTGALLVAEDCQRVGGVGERLAASLTRAGIPAKVCCINCGNGFVTHGDLKSLKRQLGLDAQGIVQGALEVLNRV